VSKYQDYLNEATILKVSNNGKKANMRLLKDDGKTLTVRDALGKKIVFDKTTGKSEDPNVFIIIPPKAGKTPDSLLKSILTDY